MVSTIAGVPSAIAYLFIGMPGNLEIKFSIGCEKIAVDDFANFDGGLGQWSLRQVVEIDFAFSHHVVLAKLVFVFDAEVKEHAFQAVDREQEGTLVPVRVLCVLLHSCPLLRDVRSAGLLHNKIGCDMICTSMSQAA